MGYFVFWAAAFLMGTAAFLGMDNRRGEGVENIIKIFPKLER